MAIIKTVIFNNPHRTIIKYVGDGSDTTTLASLTHAASGQTVQGTPKVSIIGINLSSTDSNGLPTTITRNGQPVVHLHGSWDFSPNDDVGKVKFSENDTSDIVVTMDSSSTLIVDLRKESGYTFGPNLAGPTSGNN